MYLLIFEDGTIKQSANDPTPEDFAAQEDGILDIVVMMANREGNQATFHRVTRTGTSRIEYARFQNGHHS